MPPKRKPRKPSRHEDSDDQNNTIPKNIIKKEAEQKKQNMGLREQLRDRIRQMQKDRAKGSYVCEENANHEY